MTDILLILVSATLGGVAVLIILRRASRSTPIRTENSHTVAERVRAVGRLVALEVHAKEITTSTKGWAWMPPILLSQAKVAMIFHFEKQYSVDLARLDAGDVEEIPAAPLSPGSRRRFILRLPPIEGTLRLTEVSPYDIQAGRILGLFDVIQMDAATQRELMKAAQEQASGMFVASEGRYLIESRRSVERQMQSLLALFGADVEVRWPNAEAAPVVPAPVASVASLGVR